MSTPSTSSSRMERLTWARAAQVLVRRSHRLKTCARLFQQAAKGSRYAAGLLLMVGIAPLFVPGCGRSQGELLFMLGLGRGRKVEARFRLTGKPILILIDDASQRVDWPPAIHHLFDRLAQELLQHGAAQRIVPQRTVQHLRQSIADFEKRGAREIGKQGGAEQVLWIEVQDFLAEEQIESADVAAYFGVTVKVLNVLEKEHRARVRLWPKGPRGHSITVTLTGSQVAAHKTKPAIARELADRLAVDIAKLFYDHRLGEFEREP